MRRHGDRRTVSVIAGLVAVGSLAAGCGCNAPGPTAGTQVEAAIRQAGGGRVSCDDNSLAGMQCTSSKFGSLSQKQMKHRPDGAHRWFRLQSRHMEVVAQTSPHGLAWWDAYPRSRGGA